MKMWSKSLLKKLLLVVITWIFWGIFYPGEQTLLWGLNKADEPGPQAVTFTDISKKAGIDRNTMTYDAAWCDFDNDGDLDLFVSNHATPPSLYRNDGDGTFTDIFPDSGLYKKEGRDRHGGAWGDIDNDGLPDLYIAVGADRGRGKGNNELYRNLGNGTFENVSVKAGVANPTGRGRDPVWNDFDRDGNLDLYVGNLATPNPLFKNSGRGTYTDVSSQFALTDTEGYSNSWSDFDRDGDLDVFIGGWRSYLYVNQGGKGFKRWSVLESLEKLDGTEAVAWGDFNNDGYPDLFLSRGGYFENWHWQGNKIEFSALVDKQDYDGLDFNVPGDEITFNLRQDWCSDTDTIFLGKGGSHPSQNPFTLKTNNSLTEGTPKFIPGETRGIFIWKNKEGQTWHIRWTGDPVTCHDNVGIIESDQPFSTVKPVDYDKEQPRMNTLLQNSGDGHFIDVTRQSGLSIKGNFRAATWGDYDNDGDLDLYLVNCGDGLHNGPNYLFRNQGDGTFVDVAREAGAQANVGGRGMGAAWGDYNNDGFLDLFLTNGWGPPLFHSGPHVLLKNEGNDNNWLKIALVGTKSNRLGLGAQVTLKIGSRIQYREMGSNSELYSQSFQPLHFGLGKAEKVDSVEIKWPSGRRQILKNVPVNQLLRVTEK